MARLVGARELVKISADSMRKLHEVLDLRWNVKTGSSKRKHERMPFQQMNVPLTVCNPLGESESHMIHCRDICEAGIGAICVAFIYPGSNCSIVLDRLDGQREMLAGRVASCIHVHKRLHRVGVQFTEPIDVADFLKVRAA